LNSQTFAFSAETGASLWDSTTTGSIVEPVGTGHFLSRQPGGPKNQVAVVDASNGEELWSRNGTLLQAVAASDGSSVIVSHTRGAIAPEALSQPTTGTVTAREVVTGKELWDVRAPCCGLGAGSSVVLALDPTSGRLAALTITDGSRAWRRNVPFNRRPTAVAHAGDRIVLGLSDSSSSY
jgi:outer membrane protein assembly factor BamB